MFNYLNILFFLNRIYVFAGELFQFVIKSIHLRKAIRQTANPEQTNAN
jgi:hypothetical protein